MKGQNIILQAKCQQVDRFTHAESESQWNLGG